MQQQRSKKRSGASGKKRGGHCDDARTTGADRSFFYSPEWQEKEAEADAAIVAGEVSKPASVEEAIHALRGSKKRNRTRRA